MGKEGGTTDDTDKDGWGRGRVNTCIGADKTLMREERREKRQR
jgi:hypothetical protein